MKSKKRFDEFSSLGKRMQQDTPLFFKRLRAVGIVVAAIGTSIIMAPVAIPALVSTIGGYLIVGGSVITAISQTTVEEGE